MLVPKHRRSNECAGWVPNIYAWVFNSKIFRFGARGRRSNSSRKAVRFSAGNAVETLGRTVRIAPVVPKTFRASGGVRIDNYD